MTRPGIEPRSPGPLANTLTAGPLEILIENMKKMDTEQQQIKLQNMIFILKLVMSFLLLVQEESNKLFNSIKFIYEQLNLMTE